MPWKEFVILKLGNLWHTQAKSIKFEVKKPKFLAIKFFIKKSDIKRIPEPHQWNVARNGTWIFILSFFWHNLVYVAILLKELRRHLIERTELFEKLFMKRLLPIIELKKLISDHQFGFRKKLSSLTWLSTSYKRYYRKITWK